MAKWTVARRSTDSSGRPIYASEFFWLAWTSMLQDKRLASFRHLITVVQGPWMEKVAGGGAAASKGYHNKGGCIDVRTWNLSSAQQQILWNVAREYGFWFWKRDLLPAHGGMEQHGHAIAGWDNDLAGGAVIQWQQAQNGRDGLARNGPDYMKRNGPIVLAPPARLLEEEMADSDEILRTVKRIERGLSTFRANEAERDKAAAEKARNVAKRQIQVLGGVVDQLGTLATETDIKALQKKLAAMQASITTHLADDPDVDGADNPA